MSNDWIAFIGFVALFVLMMLRVPVGMAMGLVGVTGYSVETCSGAGCSNFVQIATPTDTTFNNTGLTASTSYSYRVRATDA